MKMLYILTLLLVCRCVCQCAMDLPDLLDLPDLPPVVNLVSDDEECADFGQSSQHDKTFIDLDFNPDKE